MLKARVTCQQTSNEVYGFSKLKRFLAYMNSRTQDTLRFLVQASLDEFVRYVLAAIGNPNYCRVPTAQRLDSDPS